MRGGSSHTDELGVVIKCRRIGVRRSPDKRVLTGHEIMSFPVSSGPHTSRESLHRSRQVIATCRPITWTGAFDRIRPRPSGISLTTSHRGLVMLSLLSWLVAGLIIGLIARALVPGKQDIGLGQTIVLGVLGAVLGGLISSVIWSTWTNEADANRMWPGWLMSIAGGVLALGVYVGIAGRSDVAYRSR